MYVHLLAALAILLAANAATNPTFTSHSVWSWTLYGSTHFTTDGYAHVDVSLSQNDSPFDEFLEGNVCGHDPKSVTFVEESDPMYVYLTAAQAV
jgi:hypothetical protein